MPPAGLDIQIVLQKSAWYTDLGSKNKIFVGQQLAVLTSELKRFHEELAAGVGPRTFEMVKVYEQSPMLMNILQQLGIVVDDQGVIQPMGLGMGGMIGGGGPPLNMNQMGNVVNDPSLMLPELAVMLQQQQQHHHQQRMFGNMNPGMMQQQMNSNPGIRQGLLGMAPPGIGFPGQQLQQGPFDGGMGPNVVPGGMGIGPDMGNYNPNMMNNNSYNDSGMGPQNMQMGGQGGNNNNNHNRMMNNRGGRDNNNFRNNNNNNMGGRGDRWMHNNSRGGNDNSRRHHNSRRD